MIRLGRNHRDSEQDHAKSPPVEEGSSWRRPLQRFALAMALVLPLILVGSSQQVVGAVCPSCDTPVSPPKPDATLCTVKGRVIKYVIDSTCGFPRISLCLCKYRVAWRCEKAGLSLEWVRYPAGEQAGCCH